MMNIIKEKAILILDFGSQYTQLIGRRLRELGVYCEIHPYTMTEAELKLLNPVGIILSGGPATVTQDSNPRAPAWVFSSKLPLLGICYGMQTMAVQLGGEVQASSLKEFGYAQLKIEAVSELLTGFQDREDEEGWPILDVWMSHGDKVTSLPAGFKVLASTESSTIAAMADESRHYYALQFHPEVTHTPQGLQILKRFVFDFCGASDQWTPIHIIEETLTLIREKVGKDKVLLGLSGGVDSSVAALLLHKAIGKQLTCVFVDTGLLRLNEQAEVIEMFGRHLGMELIVVNAESRFLEALKEVSEPEQKRKIIGHTFIQVFEEEAEKIQDIRWLAQGTIYSDVIESAGGKTKTAELIKSHHNVGGLPETLALPLLEPLRELFKDEVRRLGLELGLAPIMIHRHPFPGVGLGVRILGEIKKEYADILRQADAIFIDELYKANLYQTVSQAFAVFLPIKSVGVMGDGRRYDYVICLRAVKTIDFMTAEWAALPWDFLARVSNRIINEVARVSRVTYDISGKPPATIEWE